MFALPIDIEHDKLVPIGWSGAKYDMQDDDFFALKHLHDIDNILNHLKNIHLNIL